MLGRPLVRIMEVEYTTDVEKKHIYGRGNKPVGVQTGNEKCTGSLTIGQSELEALVAKAKQTKPNAKVTDLVFDVNVSYLQAENVVIDRLESVQPTQVPKGMKQGDTDMQVKIPFLALDIKYGVNA